MYTRNKMEEATDNWGLQGNPQSYKSDYTLIIYLPFASIKTM